MKRFAALMDASNSRATSFTPGSRAVLISVRAMPAVMSRAWTGTEAGLTEEAVDYWLKAGERSRERSAMSEAIGHLTKGLALLNTLEESRARDVRELRFLTTMAPA